MLTFDLHAAMWLLVGAIFGYKLAPLVDALYDTVKALVSNARKQPDRHDF